MLGTNQPLTFWQIYGCLSVNRWGKRLSLFSVVLICLQLVLSSTSVAYAQEEIVDLATQRKGMHACPVGYFVVGAHVNKNAFLCSKALGSYQASQEYIDGDNEPRYRRHGMHTCRLGYAVTGMHVSKNWLLCAPFSNQIPAEYVDGDNEPATQRQTMHACKPGYVLMGIHVEDNDFLCGRRR